MCVCVYRYIIYVDNIYIYLYIKIYLYINIYIPIYLYMRFHSTLDRMVLGPCDLMQGRTQGTVRSYISLF